MSKTTRGFTIIELLIVIVVIGILAAISIVAYRGVQTRARAAAHAQEISQAEKQIMTQALLNGTTASVTSGSLVGYKEGEGDIDLLRPLMGAQDITMYAVFEVIAGDRVYATYAHLTPLTWGTHVFSLDVGNTGETFMRSRVDTSLEQNLVAQSPSGMYVPGNTMICWLQINHTTAQVTLGCDQGAAQGVRAFTTSHTGWNFTGLRLVNQNDEAIAGMVFNAAHDQATRTAVVNWLASEYGVSL